MIATLLGKELRQHWPSLLLLGFLMLAAYGLIIASLEASGELGSVFDGLRVFVMSQGVLGALVMCHRLIVVEYAAKTQLFLEALPVSRVRMVGVKYALGLTLMVVIVSVALALACMIGWRHEVLTPRFVAILAARAISATVCAYHFFLLMSFLGRYRLVGFILTVIVIVVIGELTDLELNRFGPFALLDERFAFEREVFPWRALQVTWALNGTFVALAFLMALTREGNVAALLAEKMSHRERLFVAALFVGVFVAFSVLSSKKQRTPFSLHDAVTEERSGLTIQVAAGVETSGDEASALARQVADELSEAREYLGLSRLPPIFITRRRDLDANSFERGELEANSGVHVQANFGAPEFRRGDFTAWLLREALIVHSDGRAKLEPKMWVLDGFALYDGTRERSSVPLTAEKALVLRALYGVEAGFSLRDLRDWHSFRERVGGDIAAGVAWSGLETLARRAGPDRARQFVRSVLGVPVQKDIRAMLHERSAPLERLLQSEAGVTLEQFWSDWQEELAASRRELSPELARVPKVRGEVQFIPLSLDSRQVRYRVDITPPPMDGARYSLLYHELSAFDEEVAPQSLRREQNTYTARPEGELADSFTRGGRLYWAFSLDVPALGCAVSSGWKREEIP